MENSHLTKFLTSFGLPPKQISLNNNKEYTFVFSAMNEIYFTSQEEQIILLANSFHIPVHNVQSWSICPNVYTINSETPLKIKNNKLYEAGAIYSMDWSSIAVIKILQIGTPFTSESKVADLCCAPGMKLLYLKDSSIPTVQVFGVDVHRHRLNICKKLLQKYKHLSINTKKPRKIRRKERFSPLQLNENNIQLQECDARNLPIELHDTFQKVLVDAECTNDGRQDKFWSKMEEFQEKEAVAGLNDFIEKSQKPEKLIQLQKELLWKGIELATPNHGEIIYSVCSFSKLEAEGVVTEIIDKWNSTNKTIQLSIQQLPLEMIKEMKAEEGAIKGTMRFGLGTQYTGMFVAKIVKKIL